MRKLFGEFKKFISKGNIVDLAIAVVLGNAFNKIVNTLVNSVIMPFIGYLTGGASVADWKWVIKEADEVAGTAENAILYGAFIQTIIDFLIIAICLFLAMKIVKYSRNKIEKTRVVLQKNITELTKKDKKRLKKQGVDVEKLEGEGSVEEVIKKSETVVAPKLDPEPTKEEKLLTEIRDLLAGQFGGGMVNETVVEEIKTSDNTVAEQPQ